jgi:hypothetical protein
MKVFFTLLIGAILAALVIVLLGGLARVAPGRPFLAAAVGLAVLVSGLFILRGIARGRGPDVREDPEDVADLDVFFVCTECGTEFRVEKLGELQVPRHCGEPMRVERRARGAPRGLG